MKKSKIFLAAAIIFANLTFSATTALAENNTQNNLATTENIYSTDVSVAEAIDLIKNKNAVIIDVRTPEEFAESHLPEANNFPVDTLSQNIETIKKLQRDKPLLVYCRSGKRSARAAEKLKNLGVNSLYNLKGGIKAWSDANNPLVKE
ncbi:MAG: rhodanese-like domain-containing protein [Rhodocyclaceae bacterium]